MPFETQRGGVKVPLQSRGDIVRSLLVCMDMIVQPKSKRLMTNGEGAY